MVSLTRGFWQELFTRSLPIVIPICTSHGSRTAGADGRFRDMTGSAGSSTFEANPGLEPWNSFHFQKGKYPEVSPVKIWEGRTTRYS
ncbi:hypothetical protein ACN38_g5698 [Penicillium nordicum]|uniref:Uncharacterized protein n=1 Tax=Penicillium nordicum TaxID=229535 RepID=A0A0M8P4J5_9EURO|nr:hypothetical protein ACN38_g5698 [Penicillium nordicum]